jgi:HSP20 family molecular chaperone IbpA
MQRNDFEIDVEGATLRITGQRPSSGTATARTVLIQEISAGSFESVLEVPPGFDLARASSVYANGALRITVPPV